MLTAIELRVGKLAEIDGKLYRCTYYQGVKPAKGGGFVRLKFKEVETGNQIERCLDTEEKVKEPDVEEKEMNFLYKQGENFVFMDMSSYEQFELTPDEVGDAWMWMKDEMTIDMLFFNGRPVSIELPINVELKITYTEPWVKGDTATGSTKPATLETGAQVQVPLFLKEGETVRIDTRTGEYKDRVNL
jgi:elongation factor P